MYKIMPTVPMTDVRNNISSIVAGLEESPVVLTHNGREAALIVHPETWNKLVGVYEKWTRLQSISDPRFLTWAQFEQQLKEAGIPLNIALETIRQGSEKLSQMKADPSRVISGAEMRKRMAERNVHVGN